MTPEAADVLAKARECIENARRIAEASVPAVAGREAYMAAFHAAQAIIFERSGKALKTHSGVHSAFGRLAKADPNLGAEMSRFLAHAYELKDISDYRIGETVSPERAAEAIGASAAFVARVETALRSPGGLPE